MIKLPNKNIPFLEVNDITERDSIPERLRVEGMRFVYVKDTQKIYYLKNGINNDNWEELNGSSTNNFISQISSKDLLSSYGAENGYLFHSISDNTIYQYTDNGNNYISDGITVISSYGSESNKWIGIAGKYKYVNSEYTRIDIFQVAYNSAATTFPLTNLTFENRLFSTSNYLNDGYTTLNKIIFWEIFDDSGFKRDGLRFNTILDARNYINANLSNKTSFIVRGYLKVRKDQYSMNKVVAYNGFLSNIRGRFNLQNKFSATLQNIYDLFLDDKGTYWNQNDTLLNMIYDNFLGISNGSTYSNTRSTIGIPTKYSKLYNLVPAKNAKGKSYHFSGSESRNRYLFDSNTNTSIPWNNSGQFSIQNMYFLNSYVYGQNMNNYDSIENLGEFPTHNNILNNYKSLIRVYHLVDNISEPRYHYFMIKPIGVDCFIIPYINNYGTSNKVGVIVEYQPSKFDIKTIIPVSNHHEKSLGDNVSFRIEKLDYLDVINRNGDKTNKGIMKFFIYDDESGYILGITEGFKLLHKTSGSPFKIMPDRTKKDYR